MIILKNIMAVLLVLGIGSFIVIAGLAGAVAIATVLARIAIEVGEELAREDSDV